MTGWNHDISAIPRDRKIIVETTDGKVSQTIFNQPTKTSPKGGWSMIGNESLLVAWQDFPAPSGAGLKSARTEVSDLLSNIGAGFLVNDAGSGE